MEHLSLEIFDREGTESQFAVLPPNSRIKIRRSSRVFGKGEVWTHNFSLNVHANAHIFGTAGELHGSRLHEQIDKRKARLWVEGLPLYLGYLRLDGEVDVDGEGNVDVRIESGRKTFEQLIDGGKANQVPMLGDVQIGMALWRKRWVEQGIYVQAQVTWGDGAQSGLIDVKKDGNDYFKVEVDGETDATPTQSYPRMVHAKGTFYNCLTHTWENPINFLNTDSPYTEDEDGTPTNPFCNVALCYQRYGYEKKMADGSYQPEYTSEPEAQRGYEIMPANRINSAPNFFVPYWIRALMTHLSIYIEENQMMDVEDMRRLFFVNTNCAYELPKKMRTETDFSRFGKYSSRDHSEGGHRQTYHAYEAEYIDTKKPLVNIDKSHFDCTSHQGEATGSAWALNWFSEAEKTVDKVDLIIKGVKKWTEDTYDPDRFKPLLSNYLNKNRFYHKAYATSECFPNVNISEVISALENGFGVRFLFDDNYQRVRIVLLRNIFKNNEVQDLKCNILSESKTENNIRGFRMTYGNSEDTHFYYKGFADKLPHQKEIWPDTSDTHDYSQWNLHADYHNIISKVSAFDKTCYVTPNTGDAYGIKIDKDAKRYEELHPAAFEFAGFMDAEDGDCTGEEDTIDTITMGFSPVIMNDLNMDEERRGSTEQRFALLVDETMRPRRPDLQDLPSTQSYNDSDAEYDAYVLYRDSAEYEKMKVDTVVQPGLFSICSDMVAGASGLTLEVKRKKGGFLSPEAVITWNLELSVEGFVNEGYRLYLQDNYEPNDDGISTVETHDWGLTLGIMRGSGSDAYIDYKADEDDGEGNDTWSIVAGSNATAHADTCDNYGNLWDYNGSEGPTIHCNTSQDAIDAMLRLWPNSNIDLIHKENDSGRTRPAPEYRDIDTYIASAQIQTVKNDKGESVKLLFATATISENLYPAGVRINQYAKGFNGMTTAQMYAYDKAPTGYGILVEARSSMERMRTLLAMQELAFAGGSPVIIDGGDNGIGVTDGRFSLKLRAEKPNPYFDPKQPEGENNRRYLVITNKNLQGRGLTDQFYKEYSYWVRNARIYDTVLDIGVAELIALDDTVKMNVGDVTGFMKEMEFDVDMESGLQPVTMKMMYI